MADVRQTALTDPPTPELYVPADQVSSDLWTVFMTIPISFVVRSDVEAARLGPAIKAAVHEVDPEQPVARLREAGELLQNATARQRFNMLVSRSSGFSRSSWPRLACTVWSRTA